MASRSEASVATNEDISADVFLYFAQKNKRPTSMTANATHPTITKIIILRVARICP